ncbi:MAG: RluA family pseudouridine synthase [Clostridiales bacterium]|nr:RluA family pseudouridine synthase [Clostridiales bacterium]
MMKLTITQNEDKQRLDRFLKKYFKGAPLSRIYSLIRTKIKVNGKKVSPETVLAEGDELTFYLTDEELASYRKTKETVSFKKQFRIAYEDENLLVAEKPFGLLTHGDGKEKKNHLANQALGYLIHTGAYDPARERTFVPAPVNRLDRNTTGLVIIGKNYDSLKTLNRMIRERGFIRKLYVTIVSGRLEKELHLVDRMEKDERTNKIRVLESTEEGKTMETRVRPLEVSKDGAYTLVEVELITGRTHQIRAHLAKAGHPIIGDEKYGDPRVNQKVRKAFHLTTQLLHARRLVFEKTLPPLKNMEGKMVTASLPGNWKQILESLFGRENID